MKRIAFRILLSLAALTATLGVAAYVYLQQPLFGKLPADGRLARIERSPNYWNGRFHDQIETPLHTAGSSELSIWMDAVFAKKGEPRPLGTIPSEKTNLKALDPAQDLAVWLGHNSYFVQLAGKRILIDPVFSSNAAPIPKANEAFDGTSLYSAADMPEIDVLLITHDHYDHLDYPTVVALKDKVDMVITGLGVGADFEDWGFATSRIHETDWYDSVSITQDLTIRVTPARHFSGRTFVRDKTLWVGYLLETPQRKLFFSGDSGYGPHFAEIGRKYGPIAWAALDMGQYDPRWANVHMSPEQAAHAAADIHTKALTPSHVGRFSIAPHDWDDPFKRIFKASRSRSSALWTPIIGYPVYFDGRKQDFYAWWSTVK
jgi:L-ascorbate metabolism protein UlaG (beta-lactamase superfamily)